MVIEITLDTNCFFDYFERDPIHIQDLVDYAKKGAVDIAMTTRVMADTIDKSQGKSNIWHQIQSFPLLQTIGTGFRLDSSRLDSGDFLVSDNHVALIERLALLMPGAQIEDIDHLFGHLYAGREMFITSDKHFLSNKEIIFEEFGIKVLNPEDAVNEIETIISNSKTS